LDWSSYCFKPGQFLYWVQHVDEEIVGLFDSLITLALNYEGVLSSLEVRKQRPSAEVALERVMEKPAVIKGDRNNSG